MGALRIVPSRTPVMCRPVVGFMGLGGCHCGAAKHAEAGSAARHDQAPAAQGVPAAWALTCCCICLRRSLTAAWQVGQDIVAAPHSPVWLPPWPGWAAPWAQHGCPSQPNVAASHSQVGLHPVSKMGCRHGCGEHHVIMAESYYEETTEYGCDTCHKGGHPSGPSMAPPSKGTTAPKGTPAPPATPGTKAPKGTPPPTTEAPPTTAEPTAAAPTPGVACAHQSTNTDGLQSQRCRRCQLQSQLLPACQVTNGSSARAAHQSARLAPCSAPSRRTSVKLCVLNVQLSPRLTKQGQPAWIQPSLSCAERFRAACEHSPRLLPALSLPLQVHLLVPKTRSILVSCALDNAAASLPTCSCTTKMLTCTLPDMGCRPVAMVSSRPSTVLVPGFAT